MKYRTAWRSIGVHSVLSRNDQLCVIRALVQSTPRAEADLAHHGVPGLVPELPAHVAVITPGLPLGLVDDPGHHLGNVDLAEPLVQHHQRLRLRVEGRVVQERLGVHPLVVQVDEPLVPSRDAVVNVGRRRVPPGDLNARRLVGPVEPPGGGEPVAERIDPTAASPRASPSPTRQSTHRRPKAIMSASSSRANRQTRTEGASVSGFVSQTCRASAASSAGRAIS